MHQPGERITDPTKSIERRKKKSLSYWRVKIIQKSRKKKYEMSAVWKLFLVIWILYSSKTNEAFRPASATFVPWFFLSSFFLSSAIHFVHNRRAVAALCAFLILLQHPPQITFQTCLNCFDFLSSVARAISAAKEFIHSWNKVHSVSQVPLTGIMWSFWFDTILYLQQWCA